MTRGVGSDDHGYSAGLGCSYHLYPVRQTTAQL